MVQAERITRSAAISKLVDQADDILRQSKELTKGTGTETERFARRVFTDFENAATGDRFSLLSIVDMLMHPDEDEDTDQADSLGQIQANQALFTATCEAHRLAAERSRQVREDLKITPDGAAP